MLVMTPERVVPLIRPSRRPPERPLEQRLVYALARMRVADLREPPERLAHLRPHD